MTVVCEPVKYFICHVTECRNESEFDPGDRPYTKWYRDESLG